MRNRFFKRVLSITAALIVISSIDVRAQSDDLNIFGFSQLMVYTKEIEYTIFPSRYVPLQVSEVSRSTSFSLHQLNLFFQKSINDRATFFLNIEAGGSYSSKLPSGSLEIPEGWLSYRFSDNVELKAGLLLPKFNNLNEFKNRLPLFPYLVRPIMYENLLSNLVDPEDYIPKNAYFQVTANHRVFNTFTLDGAFYIGNAEDSFLSPVTAGTVTPGEGSAALYLGENLNTELLYGMRVGIENQFRTFKFGISSTFDEDNRTEPESSVFRLEALTTPVLGEINRFRLGSDLSFTYKKLSFEGEFVGVFHDHREIRKRQAYRNANLNKYFHYVNLTYNFSDAWYAFAYYTYNKDHTYEFVAPNSPSYAGITTLSAGGGWRPFDNAVIKFQVLKNIDNKNDYLSYNFYTINLGLSTIF